jgi:hypothetical protein
MEVDKALKDLLQLSADVQDGLWEASIRAHQVDLAGLFQSFAVQWNGFADQIFPILLRIDHTSPDAKWHADPNRSWMNARELPAGTDDLAICDQCLQGLQLSLNRLTSMGPVAIPDVREALKDQILSVQEQISGIVRAVDSADRPAA